MFGISRRKRKERRSEDFVGRLRLDFVLSLRFCLLTLVDNEEIQIFSTHPYSPLNTSTKWRWLIKKMNEFDARREDDKILNKFRVYSRRKSVDYEGKEEKGAQKSQTAAAAVEDGTVTLSSSSSASLTRCMLMSFNRWKRCNIFRMLGELGLRVRVKRAIKNFFLLSRRHQRRCTWGSKIQRQSRSTTDNNRSYELSTLWPVERESFVQTNSTAYRHSSIDSYTKWKVIKVLSARLKVKKYFSARLPMLLSRCRRILY